MMRLRPIRRRINREGPTGWSLTLGPRMSPGPRSARRRSRRQNESATLPRRPRQTSSSQRPTRAPRSLGVAAPLPQRASWRVAASILQNPTEQRRALQSLEDARFAASSQGPRKARRRTLERLAAAASFELFPPTIEKIRHLAAALRASGYKSARNYLSEYRTDGERLGFKLGVRAERELSDILRAVSRGTGPTRQSRAARPEEAIHIPSAWFRSQVLVACWWLLRELEARSVKVTDVTLGTKCRSATLRLPCSKTDTRGVGVERTLLCSCKVSPSEYARTLCPAHACKALLRRARNLRSEFLFSDEAGNPWGARCFGRAVGSHLGPVARREVGWSWGGHSCRRGGAQFLARTGASLATIQWMGRWGSDAVLRYLQEGAQQDESIAMAAIANLSVHVTPRSQ